MGGPGLATKHLWMRVPMTEFPDTKNSLLAAAIAPR
jgi:hypothetical protein